MILSEVSWCKNSTAYAIEHSLCTPATAVCTFLGWFCLSLADVAYLKSKILCWWCPSFVDVNVAKLMHPPPISYVYMTLMILHVIVWCWLQDAHKPHHMREDLSWWCFPLSYITFTKLASHDWCCLVNAHMPRLMRAGLFMLPFIYQCCLAIVHSLGLMSMSHRKHATTKRANICSLSLSNVALSMRTCLRLCRMFDALKPRLKLLNRCAHDTTDAFRP